MIDTETSFLAEDLNPTYDAYIDDMTEGTPDATIEDLDSRPEVSNSYLNIYGILTCNSDLSTGTIIWT